MYPQKIVIAIDSFKGCLSSKEIAEVVQAGIHDVCPACQTLALPIADGGEGTVEALVEATGGSYRQVSAHDPLMRPMEARYGILGEGEVAVIEMSAASGLSLIPRKPGIVMQTTTYGTGELIRDALRHGCRELILGVGGSATNEGGIGMLRALGFQFLDVEGAPIPPTGEGLGRLAHIVTTEALPELAACTFHILTDVRNPLCGGDGAAAVFAPQKGADERQVRLLEQGLERFARLAEQVTGRSVAQLPGAGAGGGFAAGCLAFLPAKLEPGIEVVKRFLRFDEQIEGADLILTGEGKIDNQTEQGKVIAGILAAARPQRIPVIALTGNCAEMDDRLYHAGLTAALSIHAAPVSLEEAMQPAYARSRLRRMAAELLRIRSF